jgi:hypothetical protein
MSNRKETIKNFKASQKELSRRGDVVLFNQGVRQFREWATDAEYNRLPKYSVVF